MRMLLKKQVIRFFRYQRVNERCKALVEHKKYIKRNPVFYTKTAYGRQRVIQTNKDYIKMCKRRQKQYREWRKVTDESIKDFPYIHKEELMEYYKNKYNPFEKYYKEKD